VATPRVAEAPPGEGRLGPGHSDAMTTPAPAPVRRRKRRSNRRAEIIEAAARLFYSEGFAQTSVADVTQEVGITASGLYRHVANKGELLDLVLDRRFKDYEHGLDDCSDWPTLASALAPHAIAHRDLGVLWQREGRHMSEESYAALAERLRTVARRIAHVMPEPKRPPTPIARAWATISVLTSLSYHSHGLSASILTQVVEEMIIAVGTESTRVARADFQLDSAPVAVAAPTVDPSDDGWEDTDERILEAAAKLYGTRGSHSVSMSDLGAAVGMAGPSIYYRYENKSSVLAAVLERANTRLFADARGVLVHSPAPLDALRGLVGTYARLVAVEPHIVDALLNEFPQLPSADRRPAIASRDKYVRLWVRELRRAAPGLSNAEASIRVHASMTIVNDLSRTTSTRAELSVEDLCRLAWSVLVTNSAAPADHGAPRARQRKVSKP
jgi:AcrR family transcriptional regulator